MTSPASLHALLTGAIDYAGLFPPAKLSMRDAVARYADYLGTPEAWALGRFVIPIGRVDELAEAQRDVGAVNQNWRLSVLLGDNVANEAAIIRAFNSSYAGSALIDSAEMKVTSSPSSARRGITSAVDDLPPTLRLFVEIPPVEDVSAFVEAIATVGAGAKVRTGGVTADAFPTAQHLGQFLLCCVEHDTHFKATAGLHHPWRGRYALTYEPGGPTATMFGFLNVLVASAVARLGASLGDVVSILETERGSDVRFADNELYWRDMCIARQELLESHATFALSFGSCSFDEPIGDLRRLALL